MKNKLVIIDFPYIDKTDVTKKRPALCLTEPIGPHQLLLVAFITSNINEFHETDVYIDNKEYDFKKTGLIHTSLIKLHKITTINVDSIEYSLGTLSEQHINKIQINLKKLLSL